MCRRIDILCDELYSLICTCESVEELDRLCRTFDSAEGVIRMLLVVMDVIRK